MKPCSCNHHRHHFLIIHIILREQINLDSLHIMSLTEGYDNEMYDISLTDIRLLDASSNIDFVPVFLFILFCKTDVCQNKRLQRSVIRHPLLCALFSCRFLVRLAGSDISFGNHRNPKRQYINLFLYLLIKCQKHRVIGIQPAIMIRGNTKSDRLRRSRPSLSYNHTTKTKMIGIILTLFYYNLSHTTILPSQNIFDVADFSAYYKYV